MDISKIELPGGSQFDIKDAHLTHVINVLLGIEEPDERDIK